MLGAARRRSRSCRTGKPSRGDPAPAGARARLRAVILRRDGDAVLAIGQASHAWLSGQLARAWGNDRFPVPAPFEEVCLGALQHDIGMAEWDLRPERHPETGLPKQFFEVDRAT